MPVASPPFSCARATSTPPEPVGLIHPVDRHVGGRIRLQRVLLNLSQERVAKALGITFQQLQKYESAANRVSASRLHDVAGVLGVPVAWFFEDLAHAAPAPIKPAGPGRYAA